MDHVATGKDKTEFWKVPLLITKFVKGEVILLVLVPTHHWFNVVVFSQGLFKPV